MKLPVDPKQELFKWGPIKIRFLYVSYFTENIWEEKLQSWAWPPMIWSFDHGYGTAILEYPALRAVGEKYFTRYLLNKKNFQRLWLCYREWIKEYKKFTQRVNAARLRNLHDKELEGMYRDFCGLNSAFWYIVHVPEVANWGGEQMLLRELRAIDQVKAEAYLEVLAAPAKYSFFQEEEIQLLLLAARTPKHKISEALTAHAQKYAWVLNSYGGDRILSSKYFYDKLRALTRHQTPQQAIAKIKQNLQKQHERKRTLVRQLKLNRRIVWIATQLAYAIFWQDHRKSYIWQMQHISDPILHEIARRRGWQFQELLSCWPEEIIRLAAGQSVVKRKTLRRFSDYATVIVGGRRREYYGADARQLRRVYQSTAKKANELKGLVVSRSTKPVRGVVKIIKNPFKDGKKMKKDDILVAGMTSPEFVILMKKAAAIVTDQGGMTSHAAVVSRELGIPCIVGTKYATSAFKDGDKVEVDANEGIVRKLK